jgi:hypothetical protein
MATNERHGIARPETVEGKGEVPAPTIVVTGSTMTLTVTRWSRAHRRPEELTSPTHTYTVSTSEGTCTVGFLAPGEFGYRVCEVRDENGLVGAQVIRRG